MFNSAVACLERSASELNSLNVFPVPDGDTGTNMLLTMRSAVAEALHFTDGNVSRVAHAIAHGALMGARGNSGVILSQILRGLALKLDGKECLGGNDLVAGLMAGSDLAYKAMSDPVEGTILTVIRESSAAAEKASVSKDLFGIVEATTSAARDSVARTPSLLPVLREAGVVDAGGLGLYVILDGFLRYLRGEMDEVYAKPQQIPIEIPKVTTGELSFGYCTEFMIEGQNLSLDDIRARLEAIGESVIVVGDENVVRVHFHSLDPGSAISYAASLGTLRQVKVEDMDQQHDEFMAMKRLPSVDIAIVAVVSGEGLTDVFKSLGVTAVVPGGQTMNPSIEELLRAVDTVRSDKVVLLPNNSNIVLGAEQIRGLSAKRVEIVPTETIPQGVAALLAFDHEADLETNIEAMEKARLAVRTVEVTTAVRSATIGGFSMKAGQAIGFLDGELAAVGDSVLQLVKEMLDQIDLSGSEIVTIYYGADTEGAEAEGIAGMLRQKHPHVEVEVISSGEPHYHYIVSVE
jgi:hypothetical protein